MREREGRRDGGMRERRKRGGEEGWGNEGRRDGGMRGGGRGEGRRGEEGWGDEGRRDGGMRERRRSREMPW